jgi:hypothetical protein
MIVKDMVCNLGGVTIVAYTLGVSTRTVMYWQASNQISRGSRLDFLNMMKKAGYRMTLKELNELQPTKTKVLKN